MIEILKELEEKGFGFGFATGSEKLQQKLQYRKP
jgi:hydroxymethylpyrimidine pyrophosphatase-like HAD family hydrolase